MWLDAILGALFDDGQELELLGGLDFVGFTITEAELVNAKGDTVKAHRVALDPAQNPVGPGASRGDTWAWDGTKWAVVPGPIVLKPSGDPDFDDAVAVNAALVTRSGVEVVLAEGDWHFYTTVTVPHGACLRGRNRWLCMGSRYVPPQTRTGTTVNIRHTGKAFVIQSQALCSALEIFYPDQEMNAAPDVYDYTFYCDAAAGSSLTDIVVVNPYNAVWCRSNMFTINNMYGYPLNKGIELGRCADVVRVTNAHFIQNALVTGGGATLFAHVKANASAFIVGGAEEAIFVGCFAYGYNNGILFDNSNTIPTFRGTYCAWLGGGLDACNACVKIGADSGLTARGFRVSDAGFTSTSGTHVVSFADTHVAANDDERPAVYMSNCLIWGSCDAACNMAATSYGVFYMSGGGVVGALTAPGPFRALSANCHMYLDNVRTRSTNNRVYTNNSGATVEDRNPITT